MILTIIKNLFSRPATRRYPFSDIKEPVKGYRGKIVFELTNCKLCGSCARACPAKAIEVNRATRQLTYYAFNCIYCGTCIDACPADCISQEAHYTSPAERKRKDTFDVPSPTTQ